jgi:hypothetical protein
MPVVAILQILSFLWGMAIMLFLIKVCEKDKPECRDRNHVGLEKIINKFGMGQHIFPDPDLEQDVAFLAMVIENQHKLINEFREKEGNHG